MSIIKHMKCFIIIGLGIAVFLYLIWTQAWKNFSEPVQVSNTAEFKNGTIVQFTTDLKDTGYTFSYSNDTPDYYFYQGFLNRDRVIIYVHKNFVHQITDAGPRHYTVTGKVLKPKREALEHFGADACYVELLREDYKSDTLGLLYFSLIIMGIGIFGLVFLNRQRKLRQ